MTKPVSTVRNPRVQRWVACGALLLVLLAATALRLLGVDFGLPALNDPDEPLFMMTAFEMLQKQTLNPHWFGHPATTTLYGLALVMLAVGGIGIATGRFADVQHFASAVYVDPGIVWLPGRLFMVACGIGCVYLTFRLGRRLGGTRIGLVAALFLAANAVHIEYSQIIRTDVQASLFMLLSVLAALTILREGRLRDYLLAGAFVGLACATKWPAALIGASPACAGLYRLSKDRRELPRLMALGAASAVALFLVSPFLLLDWRTVVDNLSNEARPFHPGATGGGFFANLGWYLEYPLLASLGPITLFLALAGTIWPARLRREWAIAVAPGALLYFASICAQSLIWERWIVPLLPFAALAAARALCGLADAVRLRAGRPLPWVEALAALLLVLPMLQAARHAAAERTNDTRQIASAWVRAHVPARSSIVIEHAAIDLLSGPWSFRFPLGASGCVDARAALSGRIRYSQVENRRSGSPIVDLGYVAPQLLASCRADYLILSHYDRYRQDAAHFGPELAQYRRLMQGGRELAVFRPRPGISGGPVIRIVQLPRQ